MLYCATNPHCQQIQLIKTNMAVIPNEFAFSVKSIREQLRISQEDLAKELGVSFATVNRWENNRTQPSQLAKKQLEQFITLKKQQGQLKND